jgi:hypothetical protein
MRLAARIITVLSVHAITACTADKPPAAPVAAPASSAPAVFTVTGALTLGLGDFMWDGDKQVCWGSGGYDDMKLGTQVVVSDAAGATIAIGAISDASPVLGDRTGDDGDPLADGCELSFFVDGVPAGKGFYGVEVSHRGRLQYSEAEIRGDLKLTLG